MTDSLITGRGGSQERSVRVPGYWVTSAGHPAPGLLPDHECFYSGYFWAGFLTARTLSSMPRLAAPSND